VKHQRDHEKAILPHPRSAQYRRVRKNQILISNFRGFCASAMGIFTAKRHKSTMLSIRWVMGLLLLCATGGLGVFGQSAPAAAAGAKSTPKVLYINAYHAGYDWSDAEQTGIERALKGAGTDYKAFFMDTRRRRSPQDLRAASEAARMTIETYRPDVVIVSDDNPVKGVIVPWYKNTSLPFVFCGVNWECASYGLPCRNVTGMLEVSLIPEMLKTVLPLAKGKRIAILSHNNETDRKEGQYIPLRFDIHWAAERYVADFEGWKAAYNELQDQADIIFCYSTVGITGWNQADAETFVLNHTRAITCSSMSHMARLVLIGYMKSGEEQGDWAARTALRILHGTVPADIPVSENKISRKTLNMKLAKRLGIVFPIDLVLDAELIQ